MTVALLLGVVVGIGAWMAVVALRPRPVPLSRALAALDRRPAATVDAGTATGSVVSGWALRLVAITGARTPDQEQRLALAGRTADEWARDKVTGAVGGLVVPVMVWTGLRAVGVNVPVAVTTLGLVGAAGGWLLPDLLLRDQVDRGRKAFQYALSAYLDLVNVILAGGGGIETALVAAADAGDGWAFAELRHALHRAQRINQPLWTAFDDLGARLGVPELRDLASSIGLAGSQGARIRQSLAIKADTMRRHQIAETEAAAEATTERMNLPTAVLLLGFLIFVVFPAVSAITGVTEGACQPGTTQCPSAIDPERRTIP